MIPSFFKLSADDILKTQDFDLAAAPAIRTLERTKKVSSITEIISKLFRPDREVCAVKINDLINEAFELGDTLFGVAAAAEWARGFRIPASAVEDDLNYFIRAESRSQLWQLLSLIVLVVVGCHVQG